MKAKETQGQPCGATCPAPGPGPAQAPGPGSGPPAVGSWPGPPCVGSGPQARASGPGSGSTQPFPRPSFLLPSFPLAPPSRTFPHHPIPTPFLSSFPRTWQVYYLIVRPLPQSEILKYVPLPFPSFPLLNMSLSPLTHLSSSLPTFFSSKCRAGGKPSTRFPSGRTRRAGGTITRHV